MDIILSVPENIAAMRDDIVVTAAAVKCRAVTALSTV